MLKRGNGPAEAFGAKTSAVDIEPQRLKEMLTYPEGWGPDEWGEDEGFTAASDAAAECTVGVSCCCGCFSVRAFVWLGVCAPAYPSRPSRPIPYQAPSHSYLTTTSWCAGWRSSGESWAGTKGSGAR